MSALFAERPDRTDPAAPVSHDQPAPASSRLGLQLRAMSYDAGTEALRPLDVAASGLRGASAPLPHLDRIQAAFGHHDVRHVQAKVGGEAAPACQALGANAYASGSQVAFAGTADLHTAAHEAAHVVQQRGGVQLKDGMGRPGDRWEQHADQVADAVVQGRSAVPLLDQVATGSGAASQAVQLDSKGNKNFRKGDTITSSRDNVKTRGRMGVNLALTTARIAGLQYANQVKSVCRAFESYAKPKVKAMDDGVSAKALFGAVASVALGPLASHIGAGIVDTFAKNAFNTGYKLLKGKLDAAGASRVSNSKSKGALEKAVVELAQNLDDGATNLLDGIEKDFRPRCNAAIAALNAGGDIEGDPKEIVLAFFDLTPDQVAETLVGYGMPTADTVKKLHLDLYRKLVEAFEYEYVWAASSRTQKNAMSLAAGGGMGFYHYPSTRRGLAEGRAKRAVAEREKALDSE